MGVLASDTPSNGQVPKWNTGGTITWEDDSTGVGGSGTIVTVDGGADNTRVNLADTTGIGVTLSGTNASFALVDRDFGAVTVSGSGTSIALDDGTVTSNKVVAANITIDKLSASGTPLSTNFLAGDYAWKQVTTNMIPGLNAILATIGSGGSGGGTNIKVNGTLVNNANLIDSSNALFNVSGSDISLTITNVPGTTTDNVLQWLGSAYFIVTNNSTIGDFSVLQTNGIVYNATVVGAGENDAPLVVELNFPTRSTNYIWTFRPEGDVNGFVAYEAEGYRTNTSIRFKLHEAVGSTFFTGGYWMRFDLYDKASVGGSGGDVTQSGNNTFTGTNTFSGTTTFSDLAIGTITVVSNLTVPNNAYGAGWNGSTNVPNENSVYDEMELRAPKASPTFSGTLTNTGSIGAPTLYVGTINGVVPVQQEKGALFWDFVTAPPFMTALALSSGASFPTTGTTNDPFALIAQTGGSSANSGHGYYTGASSYNVAGGEEWEFGWYIHKTNNVGFRTGLLDVLSATAAATDGIYIEQQTNGTYRGVSVANASLSATASSYVPVEDSTIQYKGTWVVASNPTNVVFTIYTNGVSVWTDTVSANIPTNTARLTGLGFFSWHGGSGSGTNLIKYGWFSFKPAFRGSR